MVLTNPIGVNLHIEDLDQTSKFSSCSIDLDAILKSYDDKSELVGLFAPYEQNLAGEGSSTFEEPPTILDRTG